MEDDEAGQIHEEASDILFTILLWLLKQGQVIPYDRSKGNWLVAKFSKFDKEYVLSFKVTVPCHIL